MITQIIDIIDNIINPKYYWNFYEPTSWKGKIFIERLYMTSRQAWKHSHTYRFLFEIDI